MWALHGSLFVSSVKQCLLGWGVCSSTAHPAGALSLVSTGCARGSLVLGFASRARYSSASSSSPFMLLKKEGSLARSS